MSKTAVDYSKLELEYLSSQPKISLNPSEFLAVFYYEQGLKGYEDGARRKLNDDEDLREIYDELYKEIGDKINGNRFVKAVRAAELKCSNERAKKLVAIWKEEE